MEHLKKLDIDRGERGPANWDDMISVIKKEGLNETWEEIIKILKLDLKKIEEDARQHWNPQKIDGVIDLINKYRDFQGDNKTQYLQQLSILLNESYS